MSQFNIPDFFDPKSKLLVLRILAGRTPLNAVNQPGVSPNVLRFFQDRRNVAQITKPAPLAGGLDSVARPTPKLGTARGIPRSRPGETQEQMQARLMRGGIREAKASHQAFMRFSINEDQEKRIAERGQKRDARDTQRRAAGLPTLDERSRETQRRIALRRGGQSLLSDINRRRIAQGRKPFGPVVRDEPVQIQSLDEVDPTAHGSGQAFQTPDGEFLRFNNIRGVQSFTPLRQDPRTGQLITDTRQIAIDEFKDVLTDTERDIRRQIILNSNTLFARSLREIQNNIVAINTSRQAGTTDASTASEQIEKLKDDEAELMFSFDDTVGFSDAFQEQTEAEVAQQEAQQEQREAERNRKQTIIDETVKAVTDQVLGLNKRLPPGMSQEDLNERIKAEIQRRFDLEAELLGGASTIQEEPDAKSQEPQPLQQITDPQTGNVTFKTGSGETIRGARWELGEGGDDKFYPFLESVQQALSLPDGQFFLMVTSDNRVVRRQATAEAKAKASG